MAYFMNNKKLSKLFISISSCALFACSAVSQSAPPIKIKNHPIDALVTQYQAETTLPSTATKIDQMRIMHIDLDYVYDPDKTQQQQNIQALIARIQQIQPNTIFLQAFADPDANGSADQVYFENRHITTRDNLFPQVLSAIREQTQVQHIYAWLPLIAWEFPKQEHLQYVENSQKSTHGYIRISPLIRKI